MVDRHVDIRTLLGDHASFEGTLIFDGHARIDGKLKGVISAQTGVLVVGNDAEIDAEIEVEELIVLSGKVSGKIRASRAVEVHAAGHVLANIHAPQLFIDRGAIIKGKCESGLGELMAKPLYDEKPQGEDPSKRVSVDAAGDMASDGANVDDEVARPFTEEQTPQ